MIDLAVIILTKDEKLHIERCLAKLCPLQPRQTFVVDCFSSDGTQALARGKAGDFASFGGALQVVEHAWPGNQAAQFNWALDHLPLRATWILRLDADEYLFPETIEEVARLLPHITAEGGARAGTLPLEVTSLSMRLERTFWQRPVRRGVGTIVLTRFFKFGCGRSNARVMDERIVTTSGRDQRLKGAFIDDNLNGPAWWTEKHLNYAAREAQAMLAGDQGGRKSVYARLPLFWRALAYFIYRYFLRGGFLEGKAGFQWHFFQGLWYRLLVDALIWRQCR